MIVQFLFFIFFKMQFGPAHLPPDIAPESWKTKNNLFSVQAEYGAMENTACDSEHSGMRKACQLQCLQMSCDNQAVTRHLYSSQSSMKVGGTFRSIASFYIMKRLREEYPPHRCPLQNSLEDVFIEALGHAPQQTIMTKQRMLDIYHPPVLRV